MQENYNVTEVNKIILDMIIELASFDMFKINIETINIFLQHYSMIKCKITLVCSNYNKSIAKYYKNVYTHL